MSERSYCSPFTGDVWTDIRPAIGTVVGLAHYLNARRPRRKPPEGCDAAIALAMEAAGAIAGVPKIVRPGEVVGRQISDAYWQAKEARTRLAPIVDDGMFLQHYRWWGGSYGWEVTRARETSTTQRAARCAWWASFLTEKAAAGETTVDNHSPARDVIQGVTAEIAGIVDLETAARVERVWRFTVAAGRMPVSPQDDELLAAFEAALMVQTADFADHLARHGWGQSTVSEET